MSEIDADVPTRACRRSRSKAERAARIRAAAEELLLESNVEDITTKQVADRAGIGEATLFRYIGSKKKLLDVVYGDQTDAMLSSVEQQDIATVTAGPDPDGDASWYLERIYAGYRSRCAFHLRHPHNATLYLRAGFDPADELVPRHLAQGDRTIRLVTAILLEVSGPLSCGPT